MTIDYTRLLGKLMPPSDGQDVARLRTGIITVINSDGTVDVTLSGVTIEDLPVLGGNASLVVGQACQILTYRGSLLVLGQVGSGTAGPVVRPSAMFTFGTPSITNNSIQTLTPASVTVNDGGMYPGSGSTFTIPAGQGGDYEIGIWLRYSTQPTASAGLRQARVNTNGSEYMTFATPGDVGFNTFNIPASGVTRASLAAGATISFAAYQNSGAAPALTLTGSLGGIERRR
jgi:hypothetical protein